MKCIQCQNDTKFKVRQSNGGRCESCKHEFAFDPRSKQGLLTDGAFLHVIETVSAKGKLAFTEGQLYYELNRRLSRPSPLLPRLAAFLGPLVALAACSAFLRLQWLVLGFALVVAGGALGVALFILPFARDVLVRIGLARVDLKMTMSEFRSAYLLRWKKVHGGIPKLIEPDVAHRPAPRLDKETDISSYSFDRAVITERAELGSMLVANNFHFENNCAILSLDGYPFGNAEAVRQMLRRNPGLQVFAIHDASLAGLGLTAKLRGSGWFPEPFISIVDLGLRPSQAWLLRLPAVEKNPISLPDPIRERLSPREVGWLEDGRTAEVEAIRPARLMRAVYQGFARARQLNPDVPTVGRPTVRLPWTIDLATALAGLFIFLPGVRPHSYAPHVPPDHNSRRRGDGGFDLDLGGIFDFDDNVDISAPDSFG